MAIQLNFLTDGYVGHGYSIAVIGVGDAGRNALYALDLPTYCDDTYSLARSVYVNDDCAIKRGKVSNPPYYVDDNNVEAWPSTNEKDDPLYPCKTKDWVFVIADLNEAGSFDTIKKCANAHAQYEYSEKNFICITYAKDEKYAKETISEICNLLIFTDSEPAKLVRPIELILFDMYAGLVTLIEKGDVVSKLNRCHTMYHRCYDFDTMEDAENAVKIIKQELKKIDKGENTIHAIVAGKGCSETGDYEYAAHKLTEHLWESNEVAVFQIKPTYKPIKSHISLLYGLAPFGERSILQAMNAWHDELRKEHLGEEEIEISLNDL